eukprot:1160464-Pelagomonas_calceolata.AAC.3
MHSLQTHSHDLRPGPTQRNCIGDAQKSCIWAKLMHSLQTHIHDLRPGPAQRNCIGDAQKSCIWAKLMHSLQTHSHDLWPGVTLLQCTESDSETQKVMMRAWSLEVSARLYPTTPITQVCGCFGAHQVQIHKLSNPVANSWHGASSRGWTYGLHHPVGNKQATQKRPCPPWLDSYRAGPQSFQQGVPPHDWT